MPLCGSLGLWFARFYCFYKFPWNCNIWPFVLVFSSLIYLTDERLAKIATHMKKNSQSLLKNLHYITWLGHWNTWSQIVEIRLRWWFADFKHPIFRNHPLTFAGTDIKGARYQIQPSKQHNCKQTASTQFHLLHIATFNFCTQLLSPPTRTCLTLLARWLTDVLFPTHCPLAIFRLPAGVKSAENCFLSVTIPPFILPRIQSFFPANVAHVSSISLDVSFMFFHFRPILPFEFSGALFPP